MKNIIKNITTMMLLVAGLAISFVPANAAVTANFTTDIDVFFPVVCPNGLPGETIELTGPLHVLVLFTINDNNVSGKIQHQPEGVTGVGLTTGDQYRGTGVTETTFTMSLQNGQANMNFVNNFRLIGQGKAINYLVHEDMHLTINADGTTTANFDHFSIDCK